MSTKANRPPPGEPFVWQTQKLRASDAWRSAGINARRFIDFLLLELMNGAGKKNGKLKAPHRELIAFGIGPQYVAGAVCEAEQLGLVECYRSGLRVATTYALAWLPLHDSTPATNRWRVYRDPTLRPLQRSKSKNLPTESKAALPTEGKADGPNLPTEGKADGPQNLPTERKALYRSSYQGGNDNSDLSEPASAAAAPRVANGATHPGALTPAANASVGSAKLPWRAPVIVELSRVRRR
jgi:hypothetical protein